jgi:hypothetical protein
LSFNQVTSETPAKGIGRQFIEELPILPCQASELVKAHSEGNILDGDLAIAGKHQFSPQGVETHPPDTIVK